MALLAGTIGLLGMVSGYGWLYRQNVDLGMCIAIDPVDMTVISFAEPCYRIQAHLPVSLRGYVPDFFEPAHQVDHWMRPGLWARSAAPLTNEQMKEFFSDVSPEEFESLPPKIKHRLENMNPSGNSPDL